ncbi:MAG: anthranilate phosphoribosyltransferase [Solirubrobacterales bacterium]
MPNEVLTRAIDAVASGTDLSAAQAQEVLAEIMAGEVGEAQTAGFLIALRAKGETVDELTGLARTMRELAVPVDAGRAELLDTAGTGGGVLTFNVSTTAAFVAAGAGCCVAKHGNRSATSRSGSADLLEALGARIDVDAAGVARCIEEVGFGFMFAPAHHQATRHVVPVRKELGVRTIFNFLGPLTNPAGATRQLIGVADPAFLELIAGALERLGAHHALVVSSSDGLDELSVSAETRVVEVRGDGTRSYTVSPEDVGLERADHADLRGGEPEENAAIARAILEGEPGPRRALVAFNAGAALMVAGRAASLEEGVRLAEQTLDSGAALQSMESFVSKTRELAPEEVGERAR